jgi:hypothetical protein
MNKLIWFILSKNRPLQLDALLRSMGEMVGPEFDCVVLYKATDERYASAYADVFHRHEQMNLENVSERDFKADVINIVRSHGHERIAFLVDDLVFTAPVNLKDVFALDPNVVTYSLRLGNRICWSQPLGVGTDKPPFLQIMDLPKNLLAWRWADGHGDWRGANCLDGNVLSRAMVSEALNHPVAERIAGPQTLEMSLNASGIATRFGICSMEPQVVNLAFNRVSDEAYWYPHGTLSSDKMLAAWEAGYQMSLKKSSSIRSKLLSSNL